MGSWRSGIAVVGAVAVVAVAACASEGRAVDAPRSETPRITVDVSRRDLDAVLLSDADVEAAMSLSVVASDLEDVELYENPDPRGPCGTPIAALPAGIAGRGFTSPSLTLVELVYDTADAATYVDQVGADLDPSCPGHTSRTNYGVDQEVGTPTPLDLAAIGDRSVGWTTTVTVSGQRAHGGAVVTVVGRHTAFLQVVAPMSIDADAVVQLARAAAERLAG